MQIVFLSNRPAVLRETLDHVRHFVPWADDVVVLAPAATLDRLDSPVPVTRISEEELLAPDERADLNHQARLLEHFPRHRGLQRLADFDAAARQTPLQRQRLVTALDQQHAAAIVQYHRANARHGPLRIFARR